MQPKKGGRPRVPKTELGRRLQAAGITPVQLAERVNALAGVTVLKIGTFITKGGRTYRRAAAIDNALQGRNILEPGTAAWVDLVLRE